MKYSDRTEFVVQCHETAIGLHRLHNNPEALHLRYNFRTVYTFCALFLSAEIHRNPTALFHPTCGIGMLPRNVSIFPPNHTARLVPDSSDTTKRHVNKTSRNVS